MSDNTAVTTPVTKAATALGTSAGASVLSVTQQAQAFLPTTLSEWMAFAASTFALLYSVHLLGDWYWKKFWRPVFERLGWIAPKPAPRVFVIDPDKLKADGE